MAERNNERGSSDCQLKGTSGVPCGACKFLRRRCVNGCIFAPHFSPDEGTILFGGVHKVFGASNVSKLLMRLPVHQRQHAVETIVFEAQARLSDPVYGCVSVIIGLQQQIATLQMELAMVHNKLINNRLVMANALQPVYTTGPSSQLTFDPLQISQPFKKNKDDDEDGRGSL